MNIIEEAYRNLYPEKEFNFNGAVKYSGHFKPYNANIKYWGGQLQVNLSREWRKIDKEIKIGLIQSLMVKLWKTRKTTMNIDFYNNFLKKIYLITPKVQSDAVLEASFNRVNEKYFNGMMEKPNLVWGGETLRKLGSYDLQSDKISISTVFKKMEEQFLDYVMYHETLHKKHKFNYKEGRNYFHTSAFKLAESQFENAERVEKEMNYFLRGSKRKVSWWSLLGFK